jgi:hypothetical protein
MRNYSRIEKAPFSGLFHISAMAMPLLWNLVPFHIEDEVPPADLSVRNNLLSASIEGEEMIFNLDGITDDAADSAMNFVERLLRVRHFISP